jgi:membrane-associated phospholipid phosphatase
LEYSTEIDALVVAPTLELPPRWDERLARGISDVLSPPILAVVGILLVTTLLESPSGLWWVGYFLTLTVVFPVAYLIWKVRRGEISDFHIRLREQRIRPMALTLACSITALGSLWAGHAPRVLQIFSGMAVLQIGLLFLVTLRWKISGHGAAIGSLAIFLWGLYGSVAAPALLAIPMVAWARVRLHRHTPAQTLAGSIVGVVFTSSLLYILSLAQQ